MKKKSIVWQQILLIAPIVLLIVIGISTFLSIHSTSIIKEEKKQISASNTKLVAEGIENLFEDTKLTAKQIVYAIKHMHLSDDKLQKLLKNSIKELNHIYPEIVGASIAFGENMRQLTETGCIWYVQIKDSKEKFKIFNNENDNNFGIDSFRKSNSNSTSWSEPYINTSLGNIRTTTFSYPFYKEIKNKNVFAGVVTIDIALDKLESHLNKLTISDSYAFLLSNTGHIIAHPNKSIIMKDTIFDLAKENNDEYKDFWQNVIFNKTTDCINYPFYDICILNGNNKKDSIIAYTNLKNGWLLGNIISNDIIFSDLDDTQHYAIFLALNTILLSLIVLAIISFQDLEPLRELSELSICIGNGDFDKTIPQTGNCLEVEQLQQSFVKLQKSLKKYVKEIEISTAQKKSLDKELEIGKDIQQSLLPKLEDTKEYKLYASLKSAKVIGGDLYDFFHISPTQICLAIGNISASGIPASLLMAVTQTLQHSFIQENVTNPSVLLTKMNKMLCKNNKSSMFVTYFFAIIDLESRLMTYSNAGHQSFYILKENGELAASQNTQGMPLGLNPSTTYSCTTQKISIGDTIFLHTEGIVSARNSDSKIFGYKKLKESLQNVAEKGLSAIEICQAIGKNIEDFTQEVEQVDDYTMFAIKLLK